MRRNGLTLWEIIGVLALLLLAAAILFPIFARPPGQPREYLCQNNLKQLALGFKHYTMDFDQGFPIVAVTNHASTNYTPPYGWADALQPYIRNTQVYRCPLDEHENQDNSGKTGFTDYWYNRNLAGLSETKLRSKAQTVICGDGHDGTEVTNARYSLSSLPPHWLTTKGSPALRHPHQQPLGANYAFADGRVKRYTPAQISSAPMAQNGFTFAPR